MLHYGAMIGIERRDFLRMMLPIAFASGLVATACAQLPTETSPKLDQGKQRLNDELDKLPDSPIKSLLFVRVKPLFGPNPPTSINYDGLEVKVLNPRVFLKTVNAAGVSAEYSPRNSSSIDLEPLYPIRETHLKVPYLGLVLASEKSIIPAENIANDGTILLDVGFSTRMPLYEGLWPAITITTPESSYIKPAYKQLFKNFERLAYIKEACSLLLLDILIEETVKTMRGLDLDPTIEVKTPAGTIRQAEALIQSMQEINNSQGRLAAVIDMAGYLLAFKAVEHTEIDDPNNMDPHFVKVRPSMQTASLGTSPQDILYNSFRWVLTTPEADKYLVHVGNLNQIP